MRGLRNFVLVLLNVLWIGLFVYVMLKLLL